jgi:hypothetical protein
MAVKLDPRTVRIASVVGFAVLAMVVCFTLGRYTAPEANVVRLEFPKGGLFGSSPVEEPKSKKVIPPPTPAGLPVQHGDIVVEVISAEIKKPTYTKMFGDTEQLDEECLVVSYRVSNKNQNKRYHYTRYIPTLTDNFDNTYKRVDIKGTAEGEIGGFEPTLDPGQSITDATVYEKPFPNAKTLTLIISGAQIHEQPGMSFKDHSKEGYRFLIPMGFVKRN